MALSPSVFSRPVGKSPFDKWHGCIVITGRFCFRRRCILHFVFITGHGVGFKVYGWQLVGENDVEK
jgi:hypothetical protein